MFASDKIYHDSKPEEIENGVPDSALHRNVELAVIDVDRKGWVRGLVISPLTIYGMGSGVVGEGKSIWNHVHIDDVADSYIVLLDSILKKKLMLFLTAARVICLVHGLPRAGLERPRSCGADSRTGMKPKCTTSDLYALIKPEVEVHARAAEALA
ncbi:hypothetical protein PYCCODRAFT_1421511 [Trametes coccinea BRFM310]|uniref:NAD-dependent epimerase/dehydratase domain-containing protein n=1 Tax=Trametes coccinea (strain BRFM310) TaxID=1353009 RepID=A0A1Y2J8V9_TRAC3|nr:hypothetical protein PYCCODRAFT_1421511 [Trametes coccinea BRFM310]